jgi:molecular chaperone Hsp33
MLADKLQNFIFEDYPVKGSLVHLHSSWQEVRSHARPPLELGHLLAEVVSASVLLTSNIKFQGLVSLQIQSGGQVSLVLGQCTDKCEIRGILRTRDGIEAPRLENPILSINLEPADGGQPYQGIVTFPEGSVAGALEEYFEKSEQLKTRIWLAVGDHCCSGLMLQKLPGHPIDSDSWNRIGALAATVSNRELLDLGAGELLRKLFFEESIRLFDPKPVRFGCRCSKQRVGQMLRGLGYDEAKSIIEQDGAIEIRCEYCGQTYHFDRVDTAQLFVASGHLVSQSLTSQ